MHIVEGNVEYWLAASSSDVSNQGIIAEEDVGIVPLPAILS